MRRYRIAGMRVESEMALPGLIAESSVDTVAEITILHADVPDALDDGAGDRDALWQMRGDQVLIRVPGVARFLLTGGRSVGVALEPGAPSADAAIYLIGSVFGTLLHQRGHIVLHASAVRVAARAVLFVGPSGAGKSTMAAALGAHGYPLISDDLCAIAFDAEGGPRVQPDGRQLKLWADAVDNLALADRRGEAVMHRQDKFYVEPDRSFAAPLPIGAVYALHAAEDGFPPGIRAMPGADGAFLLRHNAYRPALVEQMNQKALYFRAVAAIALKAGVYDLTRTLDFDRMPDLISGLERHWREIGLLTPPDEEQDFR